MTHVKAVSRGVKTYVKRCLSVIHKLADFLFVSYLSDKSARD